MKILYFKIIKFDADMTMGSDARMTIAVTCMTMGFDARMTICNNSTGSHVIAR
jgi:hypothetical protein